MKSQIIKVGLFLVGVYRSLAADELFGIAEIPVPTLPDVAIASFAPNGQPVIFYNPTIVQRCHPHYVMFIRAHEYAHHRNGDVKRYMFANNPYARIQFAREGEINADRWATEYWMKKDPDVVAGAIEFMRMTPNMGDLTHLPTVTRVRLIEQYAEEFQKSGQGTRSTEDDDNGPSITGTWSGDIETPQGDLPIVIHIRKRGSRLSATADSPAQGARGIPVSSIRFDDGELTFSISSLNVRFRGSLDGDEISGDFRQHGRSTRLTLTKN
jgi:hypothetical protein